MIEPANANKIRLAAEAMGFECFTGESKVVKPAVLWASTKDGHNVGDVRTPEKTINAWILNARHKQAPTTLAFQVIYAGGFYQARVIDPIGKPIELYVDYSYGVKEAQSYGYLKEYVEEVSARRDADYNDGEIWLKRNYAMETAGDLFRWIDELLDLFKSDHPKVSPKPREKKPERTLMDDFKDKEWIG